MRNGAHPYCFLQILRPSSRRNHRRERASRLSAQTGPHHAFVTSQFEHTSQNLLQFSRPSLRNAVTAGTPYATSTLQQTLKPLLLTAPQPGKRFDHELSGLNPKRTSYLDHHRQTRRSQPALKQAWIGAVHVRGVAQRILTKALPGARTLQYRTECARDLAAVKRVGIHGLAD